MSTIDPAVETIEAQRLARSLSHNELCSAAGVHPSTWYFLRHGQQAPLPETVKRLKAAVEAAPLTEKRSVQPLAALVRAIEGTLVAMIGGDPALIAAVTFERTRKEAPLCVAPGRIRTLALYVATVELLFGNADVGRALGVTRQNVQKARNTVEDLAGDVCVRGLLDRCAAQLRGQP